MNIKRFLFCAGIMLFLPYAIVRVIPENIRIARLIEKAPRQTVTVASKWTNPITPKTDAYWINFKESLADPREVQITSDEWNSLWPGGHITIAVLPDGRPHTLNSGASVAFEESMLAGAIIVWLAATAYVIVRFNGWMRGTRN